MARVDLSGSPYYDRREYEKGKQYTQVLALPGRVAQAREITQLQSTVKDIIKSIGDSVFKDGNIVEGCQVTVSGDKSSVKVSEGKVYLNGMVLPVAETTISITGSGTEYIGVTLNEEIVTEFSDENLRDPAIGFDNYLQPGCHRLKSTAVPVKIEGTLEDSEAAVITTLIDGEISVEKYAPDYDAITQTLARRTYDESGSYIVEGLNVRVEPYTADNEKFTAVIEAGKAYVLGYELKIPAARRLQIPRSIETDEVTEIGKTYTSSQSLYQLSSTGDVKSITAIVGLITKTATLTCTGNNSSQDFIDAYSEIKKVYVGSTTYTVREAGSSATADCEYSKSGGSTTIRWLGTSNYPSSVYNVDYTYTNTFINGTDYKLSVKENGRSGSYIQWKSAQRPANNTQFSVTYEQYRERKDTIYINQYGDIDVVTGTPAVRNYSTQPDAPLNTLPLAHILNPPGGSVSGNSDEKILVSNVGLTRFTMNDIQKIINRIRTLEYDQTVLSLNDEARNYNTATDKRGIFTDPLVDFSKVEFNKADDGTKIDNTLPQYNLTMDFYGGMCYAPTESETYDAILDETTTTATKYSRIATLKKKTGADAESIVLSQMKATKAFQINPYSVYPKSPEISITPAVDNWIDDRIIEVPVSHTTSQVVSTSTKNLSTTVTQSGNFETYSESTSNVSVNEIGRTKKVSTSESVVSTQAITYIRQRTITIKGSNFHPNTKKLVCYFDGVKVNLTPISPTQANASLTGSVDADSNGRFSATFTIPDKIRTGIREVRVESKDTGKVDNIEYSAFTLYQASGTLRTIQRTVTTITNILLNRVTTVNKTTYVDPVGQTFVLDRMTILSGIDLYFKDKATDAPVTCEIRGVSNGTIDSTVYAHTTLEPNQVSTSTATRFQFKDPVLLEENKEYAFVVRSTSPSYTIYVAELGGTEVKHPTEIVKSNPYMIGTMMSSSNNSSWTIHQTTDIKFRLIADNYEKTSEIDFVLENKADVKAFSRIYLYADCDTPEGTAVKWMYSVDEGTKYAIITPNVMANLNKMVTSQNKVRIKVVMDRSIHSKNTNMTPMIALDSVGVQLSRYDNPSTEGEYNYYVSKLISGLDQYNNVDVILDVYKPAGTDIVVKLQAANSGNLLAATLDSSATRTLDDSWEQMTFKYRGSNVNYTQCRLIVGIKGNNNYITAAFSKVRMIMS